MASALSSMIGKKDDDLKANLRNYEVQLQQVDAALSTLKEPENDEEEKNKAELLKLKEDLENVMQLTKGLIEVEEGENNDEDAFKTGDLVLAPWSENGLYYKATIEDITSDGQCNVYFMKRDSGADDDGFKGGITEVCLVSFLKPMQSNPNKRPPPNPHKEQEKGNKRVKRYQQQVAREAQKRKQQKKIQRVKELEDEREKDKNKWQTFHNKFQSSKKYQVAHHSSIFASPSTIEGKVGVGTCGIGGKPMTDYVVAEKYKPTKSRLHKPTTK
ncbi:survival of motor neuron-related-splicing factor 30-like protein [Leptotrombidium deliense]|uniref:Survival of motor neuron-related-splicing factor 30-like protein n=1 Tax=Leptotrombidium deliense TaxID=299467 RepID=A0A443SV67_9ACAR|nr:survival of motor neuron-related-splicing factor 30-like protein [Leptotrombidium deliense]